MPEVRILKEPPTLRRYRGVIECCAAPILWTQPSDKACVVQVGPDRALMPLDEEIAARGNPQPGDIYCGFEDGSCAILPREIFNKFFRAVEK